MAQKLDPYAEFGDPVEDEDPFAEFGSPVDVEPVQQVAPVVPKISQPDPLEEAKRFLGASSGELPNQKLSVPQTVVKEPGLLDKLTSPLTDLPSRLANKIAEPMMSYGERGDSLLNKAMLYGGAMAQSLGDVGSAMTSPADLAATALTGGAGLAARRGLSLAPKLADAARAASIAPTAHGIGEILDPNNDASQRATGLLEAGAGALGIRGIPNLSAMKGFGKAASELPINLPSVDEASNALLHQPDYDFRVADGPLPDLETYVVTGNQATPGRALAPGSIKKVLGATDVTDAAGRTIARPVTAQRPTVRSQNPQVVQAVEEARNSNVPAANRIDPNELAAMPNKPIPTGDPKVDEYNWKDYISLPRAIQSAYDLSFPFRQGLGLIHTKGWWQAWPDMVKSVGSEEAYKSVLESINRRPNFAVRGANGQSFAQEAGLALTDLGKLTKREEELGSKLAEKIPGLRASNRAYTAFANKLRADNFDSLIEQAEKAGLDPKRNMPLAKEIASFVNTASGRGNIPGGFEQAATALNQIMFSPRLMASRLQMLNPQNYTMGNPMVRKQYMKSALFLGTAWNGMAELAKHLGGAEVNNEPRSSDFRQIKIGDTRIDPSGGLRPYIVLGARLSEIFQKNKDRYTGKYGARDPVQDVTEFFENKLSPNAAFATGAFRADEKFPFYAGDEIAKMFTPIMVQDIIELYREDPSLLPIAGLAGVGMGTNTYQKGREEEPRMTEPIFPKSMDLRFPRR